MTNLTRELNVQANRKAYKNFRHMKKRQLFLYSFILLILSLTVVDLVAYAINLMIR